MRIALILALSLLQSGSIEYGSPSELRGAFKIFVHTGTELEVRDNIIKNIKKEIPVTIADRPSEADVVLVYGANNWSQYLGTYGSATRTGPNTAAGTSQPLYRNVTSGIGLAAKFTESGSIRLLMEFKDDRATAFERRPSTNFARAFVKAWKKANSKDVTRN